MNLKIIIITFLFTFTVTVLFGQDLKTEKVEIQKEFEANLKEANKLKFEPQLPPVDTSTEKLYYDIPGKTQPIEYDAPRIRPLAMKIDRNPEAKDVFIKLGYGTPRSPYGEVAVNKLTDQDFSFGVNGKHHSADNGDDIANQKFSFTKGEVFGNYYGTDGFAVNGKLGYQYDRYHFYGITETSEIPIEEAVRQDFKTISGSVGLFNKTKSGRNIDYNVNLGFYNLNDNYASKENEITIQGGATLWIADRDPFDVKIKYRSSKLKNVREQKLSNLYVNPSYTFHKDDFRFKLGINIASEENDFSVFPDVETTFNVSGVQFLIFGGATGSITPNTFHTFSQYNPFVVSNPDLKNTKYTQVYGGVKGQIRSFNYEGKVSYKNAKDLPLYLNDASEATRFSVVYDTVTILNISGTLGFELNESLQFSGTISQSIQDPKNEAKAWHLPTTELNVTATYMMLDNKLKLKGDLFVADGVSYIDGGGTQQNTDLLLDISASGEYMVTDQIGAFLSINNLTNNKRERWYRYPSFGLNLMAGIIAKF